MWIAMGLTSSGQSGIQNKTVAMGQVNNSPAELQVSELSVFPNPVTDNHFQVVTSDQPFNEVKMMSITGKLVYQKMSGQPMSKFEVALPEIPDGVYLLMIRRTDNSSRTIKILVRNH